MLEETAVSPTPAATDTPFTPLTLTPAHVLMCTPPACQADEVYFCPDECPGGCGTICATPTSSVLAPVPSSLTELKQWLLTAREQNQDPSTLSTLLQAQGWQDNDEEWLNLDFDGDSQDEWVIFLHTLSDPETDTNKTPVYDLWIVDQHDVLYFQGDDITGNPTLKPTIHSIEDMTGDGLPELIVEDTFCGAHTCSGRYKIFSAAPGQVSNIVKTDRLYIDYLPVDMIQISSPETRLEDYTGNGRLDFLVHGGQIGSVGAGIVRTYTEVWSWDGTAVTLAETILDPTNYRHHYLYEANDKMAAGDFKDAIYLYEEAINNPALETVPYVGTEEELDAAIAQFAAFRLILIDLLSEDKTKANDRLLWLTTTYPDTPMTLAATQLVENWTEAANLPALCAQIDASFDAPPNLPTFPLHDQGYGNPGLMAEDVCP